MSAELKGLLEKRANLVKQSREILDRHKDAGKLPADDQAQYEKIFADVNTLTGEIEQRNSYVERQKQLDAADAWGKGVEKRNVDPNPSNPNPAAPVVEKRHKNVDGVERRSVDPKASALYNRYLKGHGRAMDQAAEIEYRGILADTAGSGHDLIPPVEFIDQILIPRDRQVLIRKFATVRRLLKSTDGYQPTIETNPEDADWTTEITGVEEDTGLTTGKRELKPNVLTKLVKVSIKELMVLPQVAELIADRLGYKFGVTEEKAFMTGDGTLAVAAGDERSQLTDDWRALKRRLQARRIVAPSFAAVGSDRFSAYGKQFIMGEFGGKRAALLNQDLAPIGYFYNQAVWIGLYSPDLEELYMRLSRLRW